MRQIIYNLLINVNKATKKYVNVSGIYPPEINLSSEQTIEQMMTQIDSSIKFLKHPEYSYLSKKKICKRI